MTISLKFYSDAGLTNEITSLAYTRNTDGSAAAADRVIYVGSVASGKTFTATDAVSDVMLQVVDSNSGGGVPASAVKLALSSGGLATAIGGAALSLGASILSGASNSVAVHVRLLTGVLASGNYVDVKLQTNGLTES